MSGSLMPALNLAFVKGRF